MVTVETEPAGLVAGSVMVTLLCDVVFVGGSVVGGISDVTLLSDVVPLMFDVVFVGGSVVGGISDVTLLSDVVEITEGSVVELPLNL